MNLRVQDSSNQMYASRLPICATITSAKSQNSSGEEHKTQTKNLKDAIHHNQVSKQQQMQT